MVDLITAGIVVILAGILLLLLATFLGARTGSGDGGETRTEVRGGGVVMIGPIPIIFGSDPKWASIAIVLAIVLVVVSLLLSFHGGR